MFYKKYSMDQWTGNRTKIENSCVKIEGKSIKVNNTITLLCVKESNISSPNRKVNLKIEGERL
jgi:hypothetical protein